MNTEKASVLIIEDSFIVAYHLKTTLENEGYKVLATLESGEQALKFIVSSRPDIILMDIMLNGKLDGVETARIVHSEYNIPIIYITALTDRNTIDRAKVTEPYGYLTKPFEDREIFTVIEMALYKHGIESKLKQSEERYFSTIRSISDAVILIDQDFRITYLNPSAENLIGVSLPDAQRQLLFDVLSLENAETGDVRVNPIQCELNGTKSDSFPSGLILISKDGRRRYVGEGSISPIINNKRTSSGLVIIFKDLSHKIEREKLLASIEQERLAALVEGQENERSRIARDLHDGLGQMLTAIKMNIPIAIEDNVAASSLCRLIEDAVNESVRISENLLPANLKDFDLAVCLEKFCSQMFQATRTKIAFDILGTPIDLDQNQKINFFRICQEAVNNALKHAQASTITVQLNFDDEIVVLTIEDDGKGFQTGNVPASRHGLGNMQNRAQAMGGKLFIESDMNRGTLIIIEAPYTSKKRSHEST